MAFLTKRLRELFLDRDGTTAVEYAMMVMLVFLAVISGVMFFGQRTAESFQDSGSSLQNVLNSSS